MKTKDKKSIANESKEELVKEMTNLKAKLLSWRLDRYTKQVKNTREAREIRKKIAIIETFITVKGATV